MDTAWEWEIDAEERRCDELDGVWNVMDCSLDTRLEPAMGLGPSYRFEDGVAAGGESP